MGWFSILKGGSLPPTDFQRFLVEAFGIPSVEARKLSASETLMQSVSQGKLTEYITEEDFVKLLILAETSQYDKFIEELEEVNEKYQMAKKERENERKRKRYANDPEYRRRVLEQNRQRQTEMYANDPEYRERRKRQIRENKRKRMRERRKKREGDS
jgi:hypothetical protein|tara:strand:- start:2309 stop:2779 length:471 start_codon:yes stop_codon:yes gene_type:complete